jgi:hypothetical protein
MQKAVFSYYIHASGINISPCVSAICRYAEPKNMRSPDNYVQDPAPLYRRMTENPQNYNRYAYCHNNPLKYTDPDTLQYFQ